MIEGKFLAIFGLGYGILIAAISAADASVWTLAVTGFIAGVGAAAIGVYKSYRLTKHDADVRDGPLVVGQIEELRAENRELRVELDRAKGMADKWQALFEARSTGAGRGPSSGGRNP